MQHPAPPQPHHRSSFLPAAPLPPQVADNAVADTAAAAAAMVARPGIDKVHLVHVAPPNAVAVTAPGAEVGHALLGRVAAVVSRRGLTPVTHAVPRSPGQGLLEVSGRGGVALVYCRGRVVFEWAVF